MGDSIPSTSMRLHEEPRAGMGWKAAFLLQPLKRASRRKRGMAKGMAAAALVARPVLASQQAATSLS